MPSPLSAQPFTWAWFTSDSAGFFATIAAATAMCQAILFVWQLVYMRRTMRDSTAASGAAQESAKVARDAFTKMERPYIYIFGAKGLTCDLAYEDPPTYLSFSVANYGKTPAKIEGVWFSCVIGEGNIDLKHEQLWNPLLLHPILIPNERRDNNDYSIPDEIETFQYVSEHQGPSNAMEPRLKEGDVFYFVVRIRYSGPFSTNHETSACWTWNNEGGFLVESTDEKYGYTR
jgi:hypothetical protein